MRFKEFLTEAAIGRLTINGVHIIVDEHAMDQAIDRMVLPTDVDRVLRKLPTVKNNLARLDSGQKFWVYDPELEVGLGCRMIDPDQLKIQFKTVIGRREGAPYNSNVPVINVESAPVNEINAEDELSVSQRIEDYFTSRGYGYLGEGRDQMAFLSPRGTVVKVLGIGDDDREDIVKTYVGFFIRNQRNPHYPRIYNAGDFTVDGETYFVYEMEYLHPVSGEEAVLEYIEDLMGSINYSGERGLEAFRKNRALPAGLSEEQIDGLVYATQDLEDAIGGQAPLDLRAIENLGRRKDGQIVIIDPFSL
jgi:hypothetical protein